VISYLVLLPRGLVALSRRWYSSSSAGIFGPACLVGAPGLFLLPAPFIELPYRSCRAAPLRLMITNPSLNCLGKRPLLLTQPRALEPVPIPTREFLVGGALKGRGKRKPGVLAGP
jgi:hypothetical protein